MPWKESSSMDERLRFINAWQKRQVSFSSLCREFGVCRPTGYKWIDRFLREGEAGLVEESRAPFSQPNLTPVVLQNRILRLRRKYPTWGPRKLRNWLEENEPQHAWPAASTIGDLLRREGLCSARPLRRRTPPYSAPLAHAEAPNDVWCADFKGWFVCGNGDRCDPLTITDAYSRFLIRCQIVPKTDGPHTRSVFEAAFRQFGLPKRIRTDNGTPFASHGIAGLSRLSIWWIRLGILPERIEPASPQQNGRHERFHLTLQRDAATPPLFSLPQQQKAFHRFQNIYNNQRPHEALQQKPPALFYRPSPTPFPAKLPGLAYPFDSTLRSVSNAGHISWDNHQIHISHLLAGESVALRPLEQEQFEVHFAHLLLGWLDGPSATFTPNKPPPRKHRSSP